MDVACKLGLGLGQRLIHFSEECVNKQRSFGLSLSEILKEIIKK